MPIPGGSEAPFDTAATVIGRTAQARRRGALMTELFERRANQGLTYPQKTGCEDGGADPRTSGLEKSRLSC